MSENVLGLHAALSSFRASLVSFTGRHGVRHRVAPGGDNETQPPEQTPLRERASSEETSPRLLIASRREAVLSLSHQAVQRFSQHPTYTSPAPADHTATPRAAQEPGEDWRDIEDILNDANLDEESRSALLLLAMLFRDTDPARFRELAKSIKASQDIAVDFHAIVSSAFGQEAVLREIFAQPATEAPADAPAVQAASRELASRQTLGAVVATTGDTSLQVRLMDETVVQVSVKEAVSQEEADRLLASSVTVKEFVQKVEGSIVVQADPLVLDLKGDGILRGGLTDFYDLNGDGQTDRVESLGADDALLALDRNHNGLLDGGLELFGDQHGTADGFEELRRHDNNGDGHLNAKDAVFKRLKLAYDLNGDGRREAHEWVSAQAAGLEDITLPGDGPTRPGQERQSTTQLDGQTRTVADLFLRYQNMA